MGLVKDRTLVLGVLSGRAGLVEVVNQEQVDLEVGEVSQNHVFSFYIHISRNSPLFRTLWPLASKTMHNLINTNMVVRTKRAPTLWHLQLRPLQRMVHALRLA